MTDLHQLGLDRESAFRPGVGNQVQMDFVADQRVSSPVHADKGKQAVFDLVPLSISFQSVNALIAL